MSAQCEVAAKHVKGARLGVFERYLTVWVAACIVVGIALGQAFPALFQWIGRLEVARVNLPVALLIWAMIVPMLIKIDFGRLHEVRLPPRRRARGTGRDCPHGSSQRLLQRRRVRGARRRSGRG